MVTAPPADKGPWFIAAFGGSCSGCGEDIEAGSGEIRADGDGGWEGRCCDGTEPAAVTGTSGAQAVTLAGFWDQGEPDLQRGYWP